LRSICAFLLFSYSLEVAAQIKIRPLHDADQDNTTLALVRVQGLRTPQQLLQPLSHRQGLPYSSPVQHEKPFSMMRQSPIMQAESAEVGLAESKPAAPPKAVAKPAQASSGLNVYGEKLEECLPPGLNADDPVFGKGFELNYRLDPDFRGLFGERVLPKPEQRSSCIFENGNEGYHEVCAGVTNRISSAKTWSDKNAKDTECIPFVTYGKYAKGNQFWTPTSKAYLLKCSAIPAEVLQSDYSMSGFQNTMEKVRWRVGAGKPEKTRVSSKSLRFRKGIMNVCSICGEAASSQAAKDTLNKMCAGIEGSPAELTETTPPVISIMFIAVILGSGITFVTVRFRRAPSSAAEEALL
jgi:hypothetical protein